MNIKKISDYTSAEIDSAKAQSPAINRYLNLLNNKIDNSFYNSIIIKRHTHWLESALAEIYKSHSSKDICKYWSLKTNELLLDVWDHFPNNNELSLFALGKLGAYELNLSSDIDILIVSKLPANKEQLKFFRQFSEFLSRYSELGFCYRLDFNLRPGGRLGPTICSISQFQDYYWTQGATWERVALNRLQPICGNLDIIAKVASIRDKFCYRKFIDYSLINDIKNIRSHIHSEEKKDSQINLKLCSGGIRDIELYINSLQVIHGGKLPAVRTSETTKAINLLNENNLLPPDEAIFLKQTYWKYREIENLIQIKDDQQTHSLNLKSQLYLDNKDSLPFNKVNSLVAKLIGDKPKLLPLLPNSMEQQLAWLNNFGFNKGLTASIWPKLIQLTVLAKNNQIDEIYRSRFLYNFITNVNKYGLDKNLSLNLLFDFIKSIRPKRSFYHLLEKEPNIVKELAIILSSSPYLGNLIASRPELLDSFLLKKTQSFSSSLDILISQLGEYKQLNQLLVSSQFLANKNINTLTQACTSTADKICEKLLMALKTKFKDNSINIIKLGKWGGYELGLLSDLDFVFVTENEISEDDIKISKRFMTFITNRQQGGEIYKIDMRLRPQSGTGAIITTQSKLLQYINNDAQAWEVQSYLKAVPLLNSNLRLEIINQIINKKYPATFAEELIKIKNQVIKENYFDTKKESSDLDLKYSPGGLVDIEFSLQIYFLQNKIVPSVSSTSGMIQQLNTNTDLKDNYLKLRYYEQLSQILSQNHSTYLSFKDQNFGRLAKYLKENLSDVEVKIVSLLERNSLLLENFRQTKHS